MTSNQKYKLESMITLAYREYYESLVARALFRLNDRILGEDLVQTTFMKAWNYLIKKGRIENMKAFLYHVLNNLIIDEYRKHKTVSLDILLEKGFEPDTEDYEKLFNFLDGEKTMALISRLPERHREIINMRYVQGLSLAEISALTGKSTNCLAVKTYRGLHMLKKLCAGQEATLLSS